MEEYRTEAHKAGFQGRVEAHLVRRNPKICLNGAKRFNPRGASCIDPGNLNALKHGFYSKQFEAVEIQDLETRLLVGLQDEVAMLRVMMRRILDLTRGCDDREELMNVLGENML
jgi:hypothetical protein